MSLPYPRYDEPHDDYTEVEAVATLAHPDGTTTRHGIILTAPVYDERPDLLEAWDNEDYEPVNFNEFAQAMRTAEELVDLDIWDGVTPEFDRLYRPSALTLAMRKAG